jgi:EmrB/QacA subfamily drug resistance transporter
MVPLIMMILNIAMFGVALPTVRDNFGINADVVAWLITAFSLPYVIFMPIFGRLGDGLGKRRLLLIGISIFLVGTVITLTAAELPSLIMGRVVQGIGAASVDPLCLAIIAELFPAQQWGKSMSVWSSGAPAATMVGFVLSGLMVDYLGWRTIFVPVLLVGIMALIAVRGWVPMNPVRVESGFWRVLDWVGMILLSAAITLMVFYISSRPITGVAVLADWRLLFISLALFGTFIFWEKRQTLPFISMDIFAARNFSLASLEAATRMFVLSSLLFLAPLYLTDVRGLSPTLIGILVMLHAAALLLTVRTGGPLGDRWGDRRMVIISPAIQVGMMSLLALLPQTAPLGLIVFALVGNGFGAGLSLVPLNRFAMRRTRSAQRGMAAGLFSMIRFTGVVLGPAVGGVLLQARLDQSAVEIEAYQAIFWIIAGIALLGVILGWRLHE